MKAFFEQFSSLIGAGLAAACCLGLPLVLSVLGAAGLGFLIHDAYLFPIFVGFVGLSLWLLYRSARAHARLGPFWLGLTGGVVGAIALWFMVTGIYPLPWLVWLGLGLLVVGSLLDIVIGRRSAGCADGICETPVKNIDPSRRAMTGAALSAGAAATFYGLYKSVDVFVEHAEEGEIACWSINSCKGETACTTAFNACTGQNECRGRGYIYVPEKTCYARGGRPLEGSEGDPARS